VIKIYLTIVILLLISFYKDKNRTKRAIMKAWKALKNILPEIIGVVILVGILLAIFDTDTITKIIGDKSGLIGVFISSIIGAITLIPGFIAFPTAKILLDNGAGYMQIAAFISSLMMVGVVTIPIEIKYFNKKITIYRNIYAFIFSIIVAIIIGWVM
jgi:uncharacterized membrane protein YraQ (UPF0718 family)